MSLSTDVDAVIRSTWSNLLQSMSEGKHPDIADVIVQYLEENDHAAIADNIAATICPCVDTLIEGLANDFADLDLPALAREPLPSDQGVYGIIIMYDGQPGYKLYVGCAYGKYGIEGRISHNHMRAGYRAARPNSYLYQTMDKDGAIIYPVCLAQFRERVSPALIILAEAVVTAVFGTFPSKAYKALRLPASQLPAVMWGRGVNRGDPLATGDIEALRKEHLAFQRERTTLNALAGGPVRINMREQITGRCTKTNFFFSVFTLKFTVPVAIARKWGLKEAPEVNVRYDVTAAGRHPNAFCPKCADHDDGRRLGISVTKDVNGSVKQFWLVRNTAPAVFIVNSLFN
ncbi:MAG: hypothetical protein M1830_002448 [Pleopsidium flavum]|nr:MAG: hypothetical protein M1830_002448 [Pleopsidium flavum]